MAIDVNDSEEIYFKRLFNMYDTDKGGSISIDELRHLSKHLGVEMNDDLIRQTLRGIGHNPDADLDFPMFMKWLQSAGSAGGDEFAMLKAKISAHGSKALTNEQIARLKEVFEHFDADNSGSIDSDELGNVFQSMGQDLSEDELKAMIAGVDDDGSGQIEFNEFIVLMCSNFGEQNFDKDMQEQFAMYDPDNTGQISVDDLKQMMRDTTTGILSELEINNIIASIPTIAKDGSVEYMKWESLWEACREGS
jgi:Ca2+-binding EF-hand superfamily protein